MAEKVDLIPVDRVEVTVVTDNAIDFLLHRLIGLLVQSGGGTGVRETNFAPSMATHWQ